MSDKRPAKSRSSFLAKLAARVGATPAAVSHLMNVAADELSHAANFFIRGRFDICKRGAMHGDHRHAVHDIGLPLFGLFCDFGDVIHIDAGDYDRIDLYDHAGFF